MKARGPGGQRRETSVHVYVCACGAGRGARGSGDWSVSVEQNCPAPGRPESVAGGLTDLVGDHIGAGQDCDPLVLGMRG